MITFTTSVAPAIRALADSRLSLRELEVIDAAADGLSYIDTGGLLGLSELTVKTHLKRAADKTGLGARSGLVGYAYRKGLFVRVPTPGPPLSPAQRAVLPYVARGLENHEIGRQMGIAVDGVGITANTVKTHLRTSSKLLGAVTRAHLVRRAIDTGALPLVTVRQVEEVRAA